ncbi:MAG: helix-turn-helix transcriptional regulator [Sphingobacteriales bacterium]|nr:helix-turn-helix transcriptional regulator [Sphingobacteriales bacterium]
MNETAKKPLNRIKIVLAQKSKTNKWLAGKLDVKAPTVSQWCGNKVQPSIETFYKIAEILDVEVRKLFVPTKEKDE